MTAEALIKGLRERGYAIRRSSGPGWVIIPRVKPGDPALEWLVERGARARDFQPEKWARPELIEYEITLSTVRIELEPHEGEQLPQLKTRMQEEIWRAAA